MSALTISIDFVSVSQEQAVIPVRDRGFLYGDSVYEVIRTYQGKLLFAREHLERLERSAAGIHLTLEQSSERYLAELARIHALSSNPESSLRLIITRGSGSLQLGEQSTGQCVVVMGKELSVPSPESYEHGVSVVLSDQARDGSTTLDPTLKTGKYVTNMIAAQQAKALGAEEALMLNRRGFVAECTTSNIFFVKEGELHTPSLEQGVLAGVTRAKVLEIAAQLGIKVHEGEYLPKDLSSADEVFITSTSREVLPVTRFGGQNLSGRKPGKLTLQLLEAYRELCRSASGQGA